MASGRRLHGSNSQGCQSRRPAGLAGDQIRVRHQPANGQSARHRSAQRAAIARRRGDRVKRREFISLLGGAAAAGSITLVVPARAQQTGKVPRIGILTPAENDTTPIFEAFRKGLRDLGYVEGKTIVLDFRFAKGNNDALAGLAAELVRIPVDAMVVDSTSAIRAAMDATRTVPIVIGAGGDPVHLGFVASISRPGGNVTGMTIRGETLSSKRLELLKQAFPRIASVTVLMNPKNVSTPLSLK